MVDKRNITYANLMNEVKVRFDCINRIIHQPMGFPAPIKREFCYLQLRFLCELIALSCLVAHGDIGAIQSHKIGRETSADEILKRLTNLRSHFYPIPVTITKVPAPDGSQGLKFHVVEPSPLSKDELIGLYAKTHKFLHRGSLKKLMSMDTPIDMNFDAPEIVDLAQRMASLLSIHTIAVKDGENILCLLRNEDDNYRTLVTTMSWDMPK